MNKTNETEKPEVDHILDPKTVVSDTDFTGLLQGMPIGEEEVAEYSGLHNFPSQGGLKKLSDDTDTVVNQGN